MAMRLVTVTSRAEEMKLSSSHQGYPLSRTTSALAGGAPTMISVEPFSRGPSGDVSGFTFVSGPEADGGFPPPVPKIPFPPVAEITSFGEPSKEVSGAVPSRGRRKRQTPAAASR